MKNFVELQKLRLSDKVSVKFEVADFTHDLQIAPMLFIVFVENAFKYGISYVHPSEIAMKLNVMKKTVEFIVTNTLPPAPEEEENNKGTGLDNLRKRLQLSYPDKHQISVRKRGNLFTAYLKIET